MPSPGLRGGLIARVDAAKKLGSKERHVIRDGSGTRLGGAPTTAMPVVERSLWRNAIMEAFRTYRHGIRPAAVLLLHGALALAGCRDDKAPGPTAPTGGGAPSASASAREHASDQAAASRGHWRGRGEEARGDEEHLLWRIGGRRRRARQGNGQEVQRRHRHPGERRPAAQGFDRELRCLPAPLPGPVLPVWTS